MKLKIILKKEKEQNKKKIMPRENAETEREMGLHFPAGGQEQKEKKNPKKKERKKK